MCTGLTGLISQAGAMADSRLGSLIVDAAGSGVPVVMVHGLGGSSNSFQTLIGAVDRVWTLRPDLPGAGRSGIRPDSSRMSGLVGSVRDVLRLAGVRQAHFVAHSMGSLVCLQLAVESPELVLSLVLYGPVHDPSMAARRLLKDRAAMARRDGMAGIADAVIAANLSAQARTSDPVVAAFVRESLMRQDPAGYAAHCEALSDSAVPAVDAIRCPTLLVCGDADPVAPPSSVGQLNRAIGGSRLEPLEGIGHWPMIEAPRASRNALYEHLARYVPQPSRER
jgi:3-oxoadipate enol-lactonase